MHTKLLSLDLPVTSNKNYIGRPEPNEDPAIQSLREGWKHNLGILLQWRDIDQNGFLSSHVGGTTNIFGVTSSASASAGNGIASDHGSTMNKEEETG